MIERREHLRLAREPRATVGIGGERVRQDLQRDVAIQLRVAGPIHFAHTTRAEQADHLIAAEPRAGREGHGRRRLYRPQRNVGVNRCGRRAPSGLWSEIRLCQRRVDHYVVEQQRLEHPLRRLRRHSKRHEHAVDAPPVRERHHGRDAAAREVRQPQRDHRRVLEHQPCLERRTGDVDGHGVLERALARRPDREPRVRYQIHDGAEHETREERAIARLFGRCPDRVDAQELIREEDFDIDLPFVKRAPLLRNPDATHEAQRSQLARRGHHHRAPTLDERAGVRVVRGSTILRKQGRDRRKPDDVTRRHVEGRRDYTWRASDGGVMTLRSMPFLAAAVFLLLPAHATGQSKGARPTERHVYVGVSDRRGAPVLDLQPADFEITENDVRRDIVRTGLMKSPMRIIVMVDTGDGMAAAINHLRAALVTLADGIGAEHELALVSTGRQVRVRVPPTTDRKKFLDAAKGLFSDGGPTILADGLLEMDERFFRKAEDRWPIFVILTGDGADASAGANEKKFNQWAGAVPVRGIGIHAISLKFKGGGIAEFYANQVAQAADGYYDVMNTSSALPEKTKVIAGRIMSDYQRAAEKYDVTFVSDMPAGTPIVVGVARTGVTFKTTQTRLR